MEPGGSKPKSVPYTYFALTGHRLNCKWTITLDRAYPSIDKDCESAAALLFKVRSNVASKFSSALVTPVLKGDDPQKYAYLPVVVPLPSFKPEPKTAPKAKPVSFDLKQKTVTVPLNFAGAITLKGANLDGIKKVLFETEELQFVPSKNGDSIDVVISPKLTDKPRQASLVFIDADGKKTLKIINVSLSTSGTSAVGKE